MYTRIHEPTHPPNPHTYSPTHIPPPHTPTPHTHRRHIHHNSDVQFLKWRKCVSCSFRLQLEKPSVSRSREERDNKQRQRYSSVRQRRHRATGRKMTTSTLSVAVKFSGTWSYGRQLDSVAWCGVTNLSAWAPRFGRSCQVCPRGGCVIC